MSDDKLPITPHGIAVIGLSCRFPGAPSAEAYWRLLRDGSESITFFTEEELLASGVSPEALKSPDYVRARAILEGVEWMDAAFFGFTPREAELMDPQHRLLLECAWQALEDAGYAGELPDTAVGVFAGASANSYLLSGMMAQSGSRSLDDFQLLMGNSQDLLTTRVSYKLNLNGPSLTVQTACSTSLVAIHLACQSLLDGECDMALAGGVSITVPDHVGYLYQQGGILSPDGHCRSFDLEARGTVPGNGVGLVVLKRLSEAIRDRDSIHCVIRGSAINNDGARKAGFTAPSIDGQAAVISEALSIAGVEPESITMVECHGTATPMGDPIEMQALQEAFGTQPGAPYCAVGSVKSNMGHLDAAAGVAGFIKAALSLENRTLPPSLHFTAPNAEINFSGSPFYVNTSLRPWTPGDTPRRAAVSSFGIGGTNAHVVLEEAPPRDQGSEAPSPQLLVLSARTSAALDAATGRLADHLRSHPELSLGDAAFTLQTGRRAFEHRRAIVGANTADVLDAMEKRTPSQVFSGLSMSGRRGACFLFPGQGTQYLHMAAGLYETEPRFRMHVDRLSAVLAGATGIDLLGAIYPRSTDGPAASALAQTHVTQPALFVIEYALASLWMDWGIQPQAMLGHSVGEYTAAAIAGVFTPEDALRLVALRGAMMQELPGGDMLAVGLPESEALSRLSAALSVAAVNAPGLCVVSGPPDEIAALHESLMKEGVTCSHLHTSHAFHSAMMDPILDKFRAAVERTPRSRPNIPWLSNVTGNWITEAEAVSADYWARHIRATVRFSDGVRKLLGAEGHVWLEAGPGQSLSGLVKHHPEWTAAQPVIHSMRHYKNNEQDDRTTLLAALGQAWVAGLPVDWHAFSGETHHNKVPLPTYPFERQRFWLFDELRPAAATAARPVASAAGPEIYAPIWKQSPWAHAASAAEPPAAGTWLLVGANAGMLGSFAATLKKSGCLVVTVMTGNSWEKRGSSEFAVSPHRREDFDTLGKELRAQGTVPDMVLYLSPLEPDVSAAGQLQHFSGLLFLIQSLATAAADQPVSVFVITPGILPVLGVEAADARIAALIGLCRVAPSEYANLSCRVVDVMPVDSPETVVQQILEECALEFPQRAVARRGRSRWVQAFERIDRSAAKPGLQLRQDGVYLITSAESATGIVLARHLHQRSKARLVLLAGPGIPAPEEWESASPASAQPGVSAAIRAWSELKSGGAEIMFASVDLTGGPGIEQAIAEAQARFGAIHGVLQLENNLAGGLIALKSADSVEQSAGLRIKAVRNLSAALRDTQLDFFAMFSSSIAFTGGIGQTDTCSLGSFLDSFADENRRAGRPFFTIGWDAFEWEQPQMPEGQAMPQVQAQLAANLAAFGLADQHVTQAFELALALGLPRTVVSRRDFPAVFEQTESAAAGDIMRQFENLGGAGPGGKHARPDIQIPYVAPSSELERKITAIWEEIFGIEKVGVNDTFFALGGNSLLAIQLITRMRNSLGIEVSMSSLFERPTAAGLASTVTGARLKQEEVEEVNRIYNELEDLSEEELDELLRRDLSEAGAETAGSDLNQ